MMLQMTTPLSKWSKIRYMMQHGPQLDVLDQMQWYTQLKTLTVRHTVQADGILVNLKTVSDDNLQTLYQSMLQLVHRTS